MRLEEGIAKLLAFVLLRENRGKMFCVWSVNEIWNQQIRNSVVPQPYSASEMNETFAMVAIAGSVVAVVDIKSIETELNPVH